MDKTPLIVSHRGDTKNYIENTIEAAKSAIKLGATALEIDVRQCGSGEIVVFHDFSLKRMFNKNGYLGRTNFSELKKFPYVKNKIESEYTIDLLDDLLHQFGDKIKINLDAKTIHFFDFKFADKLISIINNHNLIHSIWISCFNPYLLQILKLKNKQIKTGYLFKKLHWLHTTYDKIVFSDAWHPHFSVINKTFVRKAKKLGKQLYIWTVNNNEILNKLKTFDIDGIITDDVLLAKKNLN